MSKKDKNSKPFDDLDLDGNINKEFYTINLEKDEDGVVEFLNAHYKDYKEGSQSRRLQEYRENLCMYMGYGRIPVTYARTPEMMLAEADIVANRSPRYMTIKENYLKDTADNLVSRFTVRKPNFLVFPKDSTNVDKSRINTTKKFIKSKVQKSQFGLMHQEQIRNVQIYGETYLEVYWNPNKGPDKFDKKQKREKIPLKDADGNTEKDADGNEIFINKKLKLGDSDYRIWTPDQVIVKQADGYRNADWVILFDYVHVDKLKLEYPDEAEEIESTQDIHRFSIGNLENVKLKNHTIVYKMYHRATPELPDGRLIVATPTTVLINDDLPQETLIEQDLFPVLQLAEYVPPGFSRGVPVFMNTAKPLQIAINNISNRQLQTIAMFPPFRVSEEKSVDEDVLRFGLSADITYKRGTNPPKIEPAPAVDQGLLELKKEYIRTLQKLSNVNPISRADTMPNVESRLMLDFYDDKEKDQSTTFDEKVKQNLLDTVALTLAVCSEEYVDNKDENKKRTLLIMGPRNIYVQEDFCVSDLKEPFDLQIEVLNTLADTFQGKVQHIGELLKIAPGSLTQAEIIDKLELGDSEMVANMITGSIELARKEREMILEGKKPPSPQKYIDLLPYYEEYLKFLQMPEVRMLLPEVYIPMGDVESLPIKQRIGQMLLDQVCAIEKLLNDSILTQKGMGLINPQNGLSPFQVEVMSKFPNFPTIYQPSDVTPIDPLAIQSQTVPLPPNGTPSLAPEHQAMMANQPQQGGQAPAQPPQAMGSMNPAAGTSTPPGMLHKSISPSANPAGSLPQAPPIPLSISPQQHVKALPPIGPNLINNPFIKR